MPEAALTAKARAGDGEAFRQLTEPYRRELQTHCYRLLGSLSDAEDAVQETMLAAWQGLDGFEGRASVRTWLYQVATRRCLNARRSASRRPQRAWPPPGLHPPEPNGMGEVTWLEPYPDASLAGLTDPAPGPAARLESHEAISLAFMTALQLLPPRQRAVLILRDVLGFHASEVAGILESTEESVTSALKRARAAVDHQLPSGRRQDTPPEPGSAREQDLADRFSRAFAAGDVQGIVALLTDDVLLAMPPLPLQYHGRELAGEFFAFVLRPGRSFRLLATRANGQPAFGIYVHDPDTVALEAGGLLVLTLAGGRIGAVTHFEPSLLPSFGLPAALPK